MEILVSAPEKTERSPALASGIPAWAWRTLAAFGLVITAEALADLVVGFYPLQLGQLEWEFVAISQALSALPLLTLGLFGLLFGGLGLRSRLLVRSMAVVFCLSMLVVVGSYALFLLGVPPALQAVSQHDARLGLLKVVVKTSVLAAGFALLYLATGIAGWRGTTHPRRTSNA